MLTPEMFLLAALVAIGAILLVLAVSLALRLIEMRSRMGTLLHRVEAKLDLLLGQANIKFDPYAAVPRDVIEALARVRELRRLNCTCARPESGSKRRMILLKSFNASLVSRKSGVA
jgi:hypothetical protein